MKMLKSKTKIRTQLSLIALALCLATPALAQEEDKKEEKKDSSADKSAAAGAPARGEQSIRSSVSAKVTDIDHEKRQITLKGKEGKEKTLTVDKSVQRFNEIQVGDEVKAEYYASLAGEIRAATPEEKEAPLTDVTLETKADKDSPPAAGAARRVTAVTTVEKLDPATKEVTIKGPRGRTLDIAVKNPDTFQKIKTGDTIVITYTEAVAIALEKESAKE